MSTAASPPPPAVRTSLPWADRPHGHRPRCFRRGVSPILHENYDGRDVTLPATGMVMKVSTFPFLANLKGETLITTDGTTLLAQTTRPVWQRS